MIDYNMTKEEILNIINKKNIEVENSINIDERKNTGSYYTSLELSMYMMEELFKNMPNEYIKEIEKKTFLEPCVGVGSFVFSYLRCIDKLSLDKKQILNIISNIYVCDINLHALEEYKELFIQFVYSYFGIELSVDYFNGRVAHNLLYNMDIKDFKYFDIQNIFPNIMKNGGFDIIATNPPYKNLKAEKNKYENINDYYRDKELYDMVSKVSSKLFKYSSDGIINLYKLFIEEIICRYSKSDAIISLLIPNTILSDKTCKKLRSYMLKNNKIISINVISEHNSYINAQQAICTVLISKNGKTDDIKINNNFCENKQKSIYINIKDILNENTGDSILTLDEKEYKILKKMNAFKKIKELDFIINMRGEFDLTLNKDYFTSKDGLKLIRGRNIGYYELKENDNIDYIKKEFVDKTNKKHYILKDRIACQQISNIHKERRINYTIISKNYVLGNSCNFISVLDNKYNIDLYFMLGLLNSELINWYFKLTSSNNHINNYEIDNFPVPIYYGKKREISNLVKRFLNKKDYNILNKINELIYEAFEIAEIEHQNINNSDDIINNYYNDIKYVIPQMTLKEAENIIKAKNTIDTFIMSYQLSLNIFEKKL